ncbi:hypothetical protein ABPG72_022447 [Tetrahymena utriculariae]
MLTELLYTTILLAGILFYLTFVRPLYKLLILKIKYGKEILIKFQPIIGIHAYLKKSEKIHGDPMKLLKLEMAKNPKLKAIACSLGFGVLITSVDPDMNKSFLIDNYSKSVKLAPIFNYKILKNGIIFSEGEQWKKQRKMISDSFHFDSLKSRFQVIAQVTKETIDSLSKYVGKDDFPLFDEMMKHSGNCLIYDFNFFQFSTKLQKQIGEIGIRVFFGPDFGQHQIDGKNISEELKEIVDQTIIYSYTSIFFQLKRIFLGDDLAMKFLTAKEKKLLNRSEKVNQIAMEQIEKKIKYYKSNPSIQSDYLIDVLVRNYLTKQDQNLTKEQVIHFPQIQQKINVLIQIIQICQQCITMFIAALDNTGCIIAWVIFCLANYKEEGDKVRQEINSIFPTQETLDNILFDDLKNLNYTSAFIDECFRHYSSSMGVFLRKVVEPFKSGNFKISKGDFISSLWHPTQFNPDWFENPDKFDVDRFLNGKEKQGNSYAFTPFSIGPRNCIGKQMSLIEVKVSLIYFVKKFNCIRNQVPLKTTASIVYKPLDQNLVKISYCQ